MLFDRNHAIGTPKVARWETLDHRWKQDRKVDENSETRGAAVNKAAGGAKDTVEEEQFPGAWSRRRR